MKRLIVHGLATAILAAAAATPTATMAQLVCATNSGVCAMSAGTPGAPCFCATRNGPVQGITQAAGGARAPAPQFCCTPAGRVGPLNLGGAARGQICQVTTPAGPVRGQACY
jgi:hypothetical protein